jgi:predicted nucleotidyltransferase
MLSVKPESPVDPSMVAVLRTVHEAAAALDITYLIVGATAQDILRLHVFGLRPGRATRDVDFALAVADWSTFDELKNRLQSTGQFVPDEKCMHRLHCDGASVAFVDLVPFGGVANTQGMILWPPDMTIMMNVSGFEDALQAASQVQIEPGLVVHVASFAGQSLLKLFAWKDRRAEGLKDAIDFVNLLRAYEQVGNQ